MQCILNFADNQEDDGGTILVPRFHQQVSRWCEAHKALYQPLPWLSFDRFLGSLPSAHSLSSAAASNSCIISEDCGNGELVSSAVANVTSSSSSTNISAPVTPLPIPCDNDNACASRVDDTIAPQPPISQPSKRKYAPKKKPPPQITRKQAQTALAIHEYEAHQELLQLAQKICLRQVLT